MAEVNKENSVKIKKGQRSLNLAIVWGIALGTAVLNVPAYATETAANLTVSAEITASCTMSTTDLSFGTYDAIIANATQDLTSSAEVSTICTLGANGVITMGGGSHSLYCISSKCYRRMANEGETSFLSYNIYTNESYSWGYVWSDNPSAANEIVQMMGAGVSQNTTVYGEIPKNQKYAAAGSYTDTVTITLTY
jgi:spore coat protein U-like protein|tara:strand:+ start:347 stop:928 length:582 start_codon:yes stop_codon:yes gene_type:complete